MRSLIQRELDKAEEYILQILFKDVKNPVLSNKVKLFLIAKNINFDDWINHKIMIFEEFSQDFMTENGYYNGEKLTKALTLKYPVLEGIQIPDIKPIDLFKLLNELLCIEQIGQLIQTL